MTTPPPDIAQEQPAARPTPGLRRWQIAVIPALAVTVVVLVSAVAFLLGQQRPGTSGATVPPVTDAAFDGLLLTPDQIGTAMGITKMEGNPVTSGPANGKPDADDTVSDPACRTEFNQASSKAIRYRMQVVFSALDSVEPIKMHQAIQVVALFPTAQDAKATFTTTADAWAACSNRTLRVGAAGGAEATYAMGPVSNANGLASKTETITPVGPEPDPKGQTLEKALMLADNVVIYTHTSGSTPIPGAAVKIAQQIAAKIPTT